MLSVISKTALSKKTSNHLEKTYVSIRFTKYDDFFSFFSELVNSHVSHRII